MYKGHYWAPRVHATIYTGAAGAREHLARDRIVVQKKLHLQNPPVVLLKRRTRRRLPESGRAGLRLLLLFLDSPRVTLVLFPTTPLCALLSLLPLLAAPAVVKVANLVAVELVLSEARIHLVVHEAG